MANVTPAIQSSAAGEISPRIYGRTDLAKYSVSYRVLQNMIAQVTGVGHPPAGNQVHQRGQGLD